MSKVIKSPVKKWPGTVTLHDPLSLPQVVAFTHAMSETLKLGKKTTAAEQHELLLPVILDCVEEWKLEGIENPPNPFPGVPMVSSAELMNWIVGEVMELFQEAESPPNE